MKFPLVGLTCFVLGAISVFAGTAPDSVSGLVYHESTVKNVGGGLGGRRQFTILLRGDGTYSYLKSASATFVMIDDTFDLSVPPSDGTYSYAKTGAADATLTIGTAAMSLSFSDSSSGDVHYTEAPGSSTVDGTFFLTAADRIATAPTSNTSVRGNATPGHPLIAGFVVPGSHPTDVLVRVIGPTLGDYGVTGAWADPDFTLYQGSVRASVGAHYGDWSKDASATPALNQIFAASGAFALPDGSKDAVTVVRLAPGAYTVVAAPAGADAGGEALVEVYVLP